MTLSTNGKVLAEMFTEGSGKDIIYIANLLLRIADTDLQIEMVPSTLNSHTLRLISLRDLFLPDILEDPEIRTIVLNPAPKTPQCKEFLENTTLHGPKEQFIDYDLTPYKPVEIAYGKIHFKRKDDDNKD